MVFPLSSGYGAAFYDIALDKFPAYFGDRDSWGFGTELQPRSTGALPSSPPIAISRPRFGECCSAGWYARLRCTLESNMALTRTSCPIKCRRCINSGATPLTIIAVSTIGASGISSVRTHNRNSIYLISLWFNNHPL